MVKELPLTNTAPTSPADMHKDSGIAVDKGDMRWYIAECKPTRETTIRTMLKNAKYEVFVASRTAERVYANRTRRTIETIVIPGKVFVRTEEKKLMDIMLGYSAVWRFMLNRLSKERAFAFVPDDQMQQLQYVLGHATNPVFVTAESLDVGQEVRVVRGALASLQGYFVKKEHNSFIVIKVQMGSNHYVYTEVPEEDVQPV